MPNVRMERLRVAAAREDCPARTEIRSEMCAVRDKVSIPLGRGSRGAVEPDPHPVRAARHSPNANSMSRSSRGSASASLSRSSHSRAANRLRPVTR
jgi:hypothetical protein